jgi:hypothetical protein
MTELINVDFELLIFSGGGQTSLPGAADPVPSLPSAFSAGRSIHRIFALSAFGDLRFHLRYG